MRLGNIDFQGEQTDWHRLPCETGLQNSLRIGPAQGPDEDQAEASASTSLCIWKHSRTSPTLMSLKLETLAPALSAVRASPTSTTSRLGTFSNASICRDLCWRKLRLNLHLDPDAGPVRRPIHRDDDANRFTHPGNLHSRGALAQGQASGAAQPEGPAAGKVQRGCGRARWAGFLAAVGGRHRESVQQQLASRAIAAQRARGFGTASGPRFDRA